jgi:hypothetical protein
MLILDFSKAFDTVPHKCLLKKLESYGINGNILPWLEAWLAQREQQVTIEGDTSSIAKVTSGVPQGTVLGPLMFLLYINDIGNDITSKIRLCISTCWLLSRFLAMSSVVMTSCDSHDRLFLKPCWKSTSMLCLSRWFIICLNMTCSMYLQGTDVNDTGR